MLIVPTLSEKDVSQSLFPLGNVESVLRTFVPSLERSEDTLRWAYGNGTSELSLTPIQQRTFDGLLVSEIVTLTHTLPALATLPAGIIARLNTWATMSSLVPADHFGPARLTSKVGIFSTDREAAERLYAPLLYMGACINGWHCRPHCSGPIPAGSQAVTSPDDKPGSPLRQRGFRGDQIDH
jgi:hypothetical protein